MLWEPEHGGAMAVAVAAGAHVYWNAPTREDDIQGQIAMVERVASAGFQGLVLAPDHALALISPVRKAIAHGIPTVIVGSALAIPPGGGLFYLLNDETKGGQLAAARVAAILHGRGRIAVLGINPDIRGIMIRARSLEESLATNYPGIQVVANAIGSFNVPHEQQVAEETLKENGDLEAIIALTSTAAHGALSAIGSSGEHRVKVIVFDPDAITFDNANLDSFILQDTRSMGGEAVRVIMASLRGQSMPATQQLEPLLVTRENVSSPAVRRMTLMDWRTESTRWKWSIGP